MRSSAGAVPARYFSLSLLANLLHHDFYTYNAFLAIIPTFKFGFTALDPKLAY